MKKFKLALYILTLAVVISGFVFYFSRPEVEATPEISVVIEKKEEQKEQASLLNITPQMVYEGINDERRLHNLPELSVDKRLEESACAKANDILENDYWSHDSPSGITPWKWIDDYGYRYDEAGENLAKSFYSKSALFDDWKNSPSHEENIIGDFDDMGACVVTGYLNSIYTDIIVSHFGKRYIEK